MRAFWTPRMHAEVSTNRAIWAVWQALRERFDRDLRRRAAWRESSLLGYERVREEERKELEGEWETAFGEKSLNRDVKEIKT